MGTNPEPKWEKHRVADLILAFYCGPSPTCEERNIQSEEEWGLLKTTAITWHNGWDWTQHKVPPRIYWNQPRLEVGKGDVLVTKAGPRERVGVVARVESTPPRIMVSGKMIGLRPNQDRVLPTVLAGLLSTANVQKYLDMRTTGMAESQVNFANTVLLDTELLVPPPLEQQRIAEILDTLDEAIRKTEGVITKLKQMKQGLLHDLLTSGLDDNGELRDPDRHPEQFHMTPLGQLPKEWKVSTMQELTTKIVDGVHHTPTYTETGVPFLTVENLTRGNGISLIPCRYVSVRAHADYKRRAEPRAGDVLVSKDGTLGVARLVPEGLPEVSIFVSVALLRPLVDQVLPFWIREFFDTWHFVRQLSTQSAGTGLKHIHLEHFREFLLPVPSLQEQRRLVGAIKRHSDRIDFEEVELAKLRDLKKGLMDDLLTGRVRVTNLIEKSA